MEKVPKDGSKASTSLWKSILQTAKKMSDAHKKTLVKKVDGKCPESYTQAEG